MRRIVVGLVICAIGCSKPSADDHTSAWNRVGIGSVFVMRSVTRMEKPFAHVTEATLTETLVGRTATEASLTLEIAEGSASSVQKETLSLQEAVVRPHDALSTMTTSDEVCTVPAGTFPCRKVSLERTEGGVTRSNVTWTSKRFPVPLRSIVTSDNMTVTTELTSFNLK